MNQTCRRYKREPELSSQAQRLLGHLVTLADDQGIVEVTRAELAKALRVSIPTIARGLRELRHAGELEMMEKGGGRGRPSQYRTSRYSMNGFLPIQVGQRSHGGSTQNQRVKWVKT